MRHKQLMREHKRSDPRYLLYKEPVSHFVAFLQAIAMIALGFMGFVLLTL